MALAAWGIPATRPLAVDPPLPGPRASRHVQQPLKEPGLGRTLLYQAPAELLAVPNTVPNLSRPAYKMSTAVTTSLASRAYKSAMRTLRQNQMPYAWVVQRRRGARHRQARHQLRTAARELRDASLPPTAAGQAWQERRDVRERSANQSIALDEAADAALLGELSERWKYRMMVMADKYDETHPPTTAAADPTDAEHADQKEAENAKENPYMDMLQEVLKMQASPPSTAPGGPVRRHKRCGLFSPPRLLLINDRLLATALAEKVQTPISSVPGSANAQTEARMPQTLSRDFRRQNVRGGMAREAVSSLVLPKNMEPRVSPGHITPEGKRPWTTPVVATAGENGSPKRLRSALSSAKKGTQKDAGLHVHLEGESKQKVESAPSTTNGQSTKPASASPEAGVPSTQAPEQIVHHYRKVIMRKESSRAMFSVREQDSASARSRQSERTNTGPAPTSSKGRSRATVEAIVQGHNIHVVTGYDLDTQTRQSSALTRRVLSPALHITRTPVPEHTAGRKVQARQPIVIPKHVSTSVQAAHSKMAVLQNFLRRLPTPDQSDDDIPPILVEQAVANAVAPKPLEKMEGHVLDLPRGAYSAPAQMGDRKGAHLAPPPPPDPVPSKHTTPPTTTQSNSTPEASKSDSSRGTEAWSASTKTSETVSIKEKKKPELESESDEDEDDDSSSGKHGKQAAETSDEDEEEEESKDADEDDDDDESDGTDSEMDSEENLARLKRKEEKEKLAREAAARLASPAQGDLGKHPASAPPAVIPVITSDPETLFFKPIIVDDHFPLPLLPEPRHPLYTSQRTDVSNHLPVRLEYDPDRPPKMERKGSEPRRKRSSFAWEIPNHVALPAETTRILLEDPEAGRLQRLEIARLLSSHEPSPIYKVPVPAEVEWMDVDAEDEIPLTCHTAKMSTRPHTQTDTQGRETPGTKIEATRILIAQTPKAADGHVGVAGAAPSKDAGQVMSPHAVVNLIRQAIAGKDTMLDQAAAEAVIEDIERYYTIMHDPSRRTHFPKGATLAFDLQRGLTHDRRRSTVEGVDSKKAKTQPRSQAHALALYKTMLRNKHAAHFANFTYPATPRTPGAQKLATSPTAAIGPRGLFAAELSAAAPKTPRNDGGTKVTPSGGAYGLLTFPLAEHVLSTPQGFHQYLMQLSKLYDRELKARRDVCERQLADIKRGYMRALRMQYQKGTRLRREMTQQHEQHRALQILYLQQEHDRLADARRKLRSLRDNNDGKNSASNASLTLTDDAFDDDNEADALFEEIPDETEEEREERHAEWLSVRKEADRRRQEEFDKAAKEETSDILGVGGGPSRRESKVSNAGKHLKKRRGNVRHISFGVPRPLRKGLAIAPHYVALRAKIGRRVRVTHPLDALREAAAISIGQEADWDRSDVLLNRLNPETDQAIRVLKEQRRRRRGRFQQRTRGRVAYAKIHGHRFGFAVPRRHYFVPDALHLRELIRSSEHGHWEHDAFTNFLGFSYAPLPVSGPDWLESLAKAKSESRTKLQEVFDKPPRTPRRDSLTRESVTRGSRRASNPGAAAPSDYADPHVFTIATPSSDFAGTSSGPSPRPFTSESMARSSAGQRGLLDTPLGIFARPGDLSPTSASHTQRETPAILLSGSPSRRTSVTAQQSGTLYGSGSSIARSGKLRITTHADVVAAATTEARTPPASADVPASQTFLARSRNASSRLTASLTAAPAVKVDTDDDATKPAALSRRSSVSILADRLQLIRPHSSGLVGAAVASRPPSQRRDSGSSESLRSVSNALPPISRHPSRPQSSFAWDNASK